MTGLVFASIVAVLNVSARTGWAVLLVVALLAAPAAAQEATEAGAWAMTDFSRVRLVTAVEAVGADDTLRAGPRLS